MEKTAIFCYNKSMKKEEILSKFNNSNDEEKQAILLSLLLEINKKEDTINNQKNNIDHLEDLVAYYKNLIFGKKSEKIKVDPGQLSLFDELEVEETIDELENKIQEINGYKRRPKGSKNLVNDDNNFPVEIIEHRKDDLSCPNCGSKLKEIGYDVRKELCVVPAKYYIKEHRYFKYTCPICSKMEQVEREIVPFPNSMYSPSLVGKFIYDKYALSLPFYRQEQSYNDLGINISRSNIINYVSRACELLKPLYDKFIEIIKSVDIVHGDETRLKILSEKNEDGNIKTNYVWLFRTSQSFDKQITIYYYNNGRKYENVTEFFKNDTNEVRYIHADGYEAYEHVEGYKLVSCMAHARRKFVEALRIISSPSSKKYKVCNNYITLIGQLYKYEQQYKEDKISYEKRKERRLIDEKPILDVFFSNLNSDSLKVLPESKLGQAISYSLSREESLRRYLEDGRLEIDNNQAEHLAKHYAVGRKNWLFCDNPNGAVKSCIMYTIVQTSIANNLKPEAYIVWLLEHISTTNVSDIESLAPWSTLIPDEIKRKDD